jgi:hypothetical protein
MVVYAATSSGSIAEGEFGAYKMVALSHARVLRATLAADAEIAWGFLERAAGQLTIFAGQ